ncbi:two-component sensor histidine kinase [Candidatus Moduliflexus flocculans]|uniref:histidine kinase n=1 Tax=Candidatus Moduliflexus flocculans TaxID=1499966 RepID=A0A081BS96_9BACT|nr:two-component sensor histidine kinase [Candidatus Moduliflexus flocculans]
MSDRVLAPSINANLFEEFEPNEWLCAHLIKLSELAASGAFMPDIVHEINGPLSSIRASAANNIHALHALREEVEQDLPMLSPDHHAQFWRLVERAWQYTHHLSTSEERKLTREICRFLEEHEIDEADEIAETLVEIGIHNGIESWLSLLRSPTCKKILQTAYNLASLFYSARGVQTALDRIAGITAALKLSAYPEILSDEWSEAIVTDGIDAVVSLFNALKLTKHLQLTRQYDPIPAIPCQPSRLMLAWRHLIRNAIEAVGGKPGSLAIHVAQQDAHVTVRFTDSGHGIPAEIRGQIFAPFFTTKCRKAGAGLGLYVARKIIEEHRGTLVIESEPGATTVLITLPKNAT